MSYQSKPIIAGSGISITTSGDSSYQILIDYDDEMIIKNWLKQHAKKSENIEHLKVAYEEMLEKMEDYLVLVKLSKE
jgi:predicted TIM-barrel enzyme